MGEADDNDSHPLDSKDMLDLSNCGVDDAGLSKLAGRSFFRLSWRRC